MKSNNPRKSPKFRLSGGVLEHPQRQGEGFCNAFLFSYENDCGEIHTMQTTLAIMSLPAKNSFSFTFLRKKKEKKTFQKTAKHYNLISGLFVLSGFDELTGEVTAMWSVTSM